jgi:hypothetical protein
MENELPNGFVLSISNCLAPSGGNHHWVALNLAQPGNYF